MTTTTVQAVAKQAGVEIRRALRHCDGLGIDAESGESLISSEDAETLALRIAAWQRPRSTAGFWDFADFAELSVLGVHLEHPLIDLEQLRSLLEIDVDELAVIIGRLVKNGELSSGAIVGFAPDDALRLVSSTRRLKAPSSSLLEQSPHLWNIARGVLGRGGLNNDMFGWDLVGADLSRLNLSGKGVSGADMGRACLIGASLRHCDLRGVNLRGADFSDADLAGSDLRKATANKYTKWPTGMDPEARGVDFETLDSDIPPPFFQDAVKVSRTTSVAELSAMDLTRADLAGHDLAGALFDRTILESADLRGANLEGATLNRVRGRRLDASRATFDNARIDYASSWRLVEASLVNADLSGSNVAFLDCRSADLRNINADGAMIQHCDFTDANLEGASFKGARIGGCSFIRSNLANADLRFREVDSLPDFTGADLSGVLRPSGLRRNPFKGL